MDKIIQLMPLPSNATINTAVFIYKERNSIDKPLFYTKPIVALGLFESGEITYIVEDDYYNKAPTPVNYIPAFEAVADKKLFFSDVNDENSINKNIFYPPMECKTYKDAISYAFNKLQEETLQECEEKIAYYSAKKEKYSKELSISTRKSNIPKPIE